MNASYLNDWNADLLDEYYQRWRQDPASVDSSWSAFFEGFELGSSRGHNGGAGSAPESEGLDRVESDRFQDRVDGLIYNYRMVGHTQAQVDPSGATTSGVACIDSYRRLGSMMCR